MFDAFDHCLREQHATNDKQMLGKKFGSFDWGLRLKPSTSQPTHFREIFRKSSHHMNTNKGNIVKQSGNDVEGCGSEKVLVQPLLSSAEPLILASSSEQTLRVLDCLKKQVCSCHLKQV